MYWINNENCMISFSRPTSGSTVYGYTKLSVKVLIIFVDNINNLTMLWAWGTLEYIRKLLRSVFHEWRTCMNDAAGLRIKFITVLRDRCRSCTCDTTFNVCKLLTRISDQQRQTVYQLCIFVTSVFSWIDRNIQRITTQALYEQRPQTLGYVFPSDRTI